MGMKQHVFSTAVWLWHDNGESAGQAWGPAAKGLATAPEARTRRWAKLRREAILRSP